jgi:ribosomal protein L19
MIKNPEKFQRFEDELARRDKTGIQQKFRLLDAMYKEAVSLRIFPLKNPLEGLEIDIQIAKVVNSVRKPT